MMLRRFVATGLALVLGVVCSTGLAVAQAKAPEAKLNLNTASAAQLEALPGVGPKLAARIVEYRQKAGGFKSTQELMNVQGIGEKNLAHIQARLSVGEQPARGGESR